MKDGLLFLYVSLSTFTAQLLIKKGILIINRRISADSTFEFLLNTIQSPFIIFAALIQLSGFMVWLIIISKRKLAIAMGITAAFLYIFIAIGSWLLFHEKLSFNEWLGIGFIVTGVICINFGN